MSTIGSITAHGSSGNSYTFQLYPLGTNFNPVPAVYIFLDVCEPVYVGQTGDLSQRFDSHHKAREIVQNRANRVGVLVEGNEMRRRAIEQDLIRNYRWRCNDTGPGLLSSHPLWMRGVAGATAAVLAVGCVLEALPKCTDVSGGSNAIACSDDVKHARKQEHIEQGSSSSSGVTAVAWVSSTALPSSGNVTITPGTGTLRMQGYSPNVQ